MSAIPAQQNIKRPPVVVIMGHIDHGKSTLLDYIRKTNIVGGEAGGITQHLGAYEVEHTAGGRASTITFLDTPGHEAFAAIRERGSRVADIAILIVSGEDGVKPQTLEALSFIKKSNVPYIVAITKIDKPNADVERAKQSLAENEVYVEGYGGDIPCVPISAVTGDGVPELLDMIVLVSEMNPATTDPSKPAHGTVIEANLDRKKGISATLLIKDGTLRIGDYVTAGGSLSSVRIMENHLGKQLKSAAASSPVRIIGWDSVPIVGSEFETFDSKKEAEIKATETRATQKTNNAQNSAKNSAQGGEQNSARGDTLIFPIIIKTDVTGSLDGIKHELAKIKHDKIALKIVSEGLGDVGENDVKLASGDPKLIILAFGVKPDSKARSIIERSPTPIRLESFDIIYNLIEFVKKEFLARVPKEYVEEITGRAKILARFGAEKDKQIIGGKVQEGTIKIGAEVRITRRDVEIARGRLRELQQAKKRVEEVREGFEFGAMVESKMTLAEGDKMECFIVVEKK